MCRSTVFLKDWRDTLVVRMRIMLVGGGSGGHFYPLVAVAETLRTLNTKRPLELYYIGPNPYEKTELDRLNINYLYCPAGKRRRYFSLLNYLDIFKILAGFFIAVLKLYLVYPDVIFSKGSFTSVPVLWAARFLRIPVVIHESDAIAGRANLLTKSFARAVAISYPEAATYFPKEKTALIGIPMREAIRKPPADPFATLGIPNDLPLILVTGGSLGAEYINNIVLRALPKLLPNFRVFHLCGAQLYEDTRLTAKALLKDEALVDRYYVHPHVNATVMAALYQASALIVSRSGSSAIHEIAYYGKPSILIPIPETISRDQRTNAYAYTRSGAASVLEQENTTEHLLAAEIQTIIGDPTRYKHMAAAAKAFALPDAAIRVSELLVGIGKEHDSD